MTSKMQGSGHWQGTDPYPSPFGPTAWNPRSLSETQTVKHTGGRTVARYVRRGRPRPRGYEAQAQKARGPTQ